MTNDEYVITAKVGVFSGRENPEIAIEGDARKHFAELATSALRGERTHSPGPPKLGTFYGFLVTIPPELAKELSLPGRMEVRDGVVSVPAREGMTSWRDVAALEAYLVGLAFDQGHGELLEKLGVKPPQKD